MPFFISGSLNSCTGSLRGVFSGSIPVCNTGSYENRSAAYYGGSVKPTTGPLVAVGQANSAVCTGSMVIQTYGNCQRLFIMMSGSSGPEWVFITGSLGCTGSLR